MHLFMCQSRWVGPQIVAELSHNQPIFWRKKTFGRTSAQMTQRLSHPNIKKNWKGSPPASSHHLKRQTSKGILGEDLYIKEIHLETKASINFKQNPFQSSSISTNTRSVSQMLFRLSSGNSKCQGTRLLANDPDWDMPRGQVQRVCLPDHIPCTPGTPNSAIREEVQRECLSWLSNEGPRSIKFSF